MTLFFTESRTEAEIEKKTILLLSVKAQTYELLYQFQGKWQIKHCKNYLERQQTVKIQNQTQYLKDLSLIIRIEKWSQ